MATDADRIIDTPAGDDPNDQIDPNNPPEGDGETEVTLEGEEPDSGEGEGESSVIRDFRAREREKDKIIREQQARLDAAAAPNALADPGTRPQLSDFDYDDEKHAAALDAWVEKKMAFDQGQREVTQRAEQIERSRVEGYQAAKAAQPIAGIDDAEKRVFAQVDDLTRNALLHAKSPAVIAALDKYPERLAAITEAIGRGDAVEMLMMIGELRGKARIMPKGRSAPAPMDIPKGTGSINHSGQNKALEKMEKDLEGGGDRSKLRQARKAAGVVVNKL